MTCEACEQAKANPASGLYHASCEECFKRALRQGPTYFKHMEHLKRARDRMDRRMYLDRVEMAEGQELAQLLQHDFADWFEAQKARKAKA